MGRSGPGQNSLTDAGEVGMSGSSFSDLGLGRLVLILVLVRTCLIHTLVAGPVVAVFFEILVVVVLAVAVEELVHRVSLSVTWAA